MIYNHKILVNRHLLNNHYVNVLDWASMSKTQALALKNKCTSIQKRLDIFSSAKDWYPKSNSSQVLPLQSDSPSS